VMFRDVFGNLVGPFIDSIILDTTPPVTPSPFFIQDISDPKLPDWRIFFSWAKTTDPDWVQYEVERATPAIDPWELHRTITNRDLNYLVDGGLIEGQEYCYRIRSVDDIGNFSGFSPVLCQVAGGQPADIVAPTISSVAFSNVTISSARITWLTDEIATTQVLYSTDPLVPAGSPVQGILGYSSSHTVTLVGLSSNTQYYFRVRSCDAARNCSESEIGSFRTAVSDTTPPVISVISVLEATSNQARINWITNIPANSLVEFSTRDGFNPGTGTIQGRMDFSTNHSVLLQGLSANTLYYFRVRSTSAAGNEAISPQQNFTTLVSTDDVAPPVITNVTHSEITHNNAVISWTTNEPASSFVEWGQTTAYGRTYGHQALTTTHSVQLPRDLLPSTLYHFRVRAIDAAGNEAILPNFSFTTGPAVIDITPPTISNISIAQPTETSVLISWQTDEYATSFLDYSASHRVYNLSQGLPAMTQTHAVTLVGLKPGTLYYFQVRATDGAGNVALQHKLVDIYHHFVTVASVHNPPVITNIHISEVKHNSARITWSTNLSATSFVEYGFDTSYGFSQGQFGSNNMHQVDLTGLLSETTYHFRVRSASAEGLEAVSTNFTLRTTVAPDIAPPIISEVGTAIGTTLTSATITWKTNEPASSLVDFGLTTGLGRLAGDPTILVTDHSVILTGLEPGTKYYFQVRSVDASLNSALDNNKGDFYSFVTEPDRTAPIITDVRAAVVDQRSATIMWQTDEKTTSQVEWGLTSVYGNFTPVVSDLRMAHSVTLFGLTPATLYHFRVISADGAGNRSVSTDFTLTTLEEGILERVVEIIVGGGAVARDTIPPTISEIRITEIGQNRATISWLTDESSNSLINHGLSSNYGQLAGQLDNFISTHQVVLDRLIVGTTYHFQIVSLDKAGNRAVSPNQTFATLRIGEEAVEAVGEEPVEITSSEEEETLDIIARASRELVNRIVERVFANPHVREDELMRIIGDVADRAVEAPLVVGEHPLVSVGPNWAEITWITDRPASSMVALAPVANFNPEREEPYTDFISSEPGQYITTHRVRLTGLQPETTYHFQVRSQAQVGPITRSPDRTFTTLSLLPEILEVGLTEVKEDNVTFRWRTTLPTRTRIEITDVETGEQIVKEEPSLLREHQLTVTALDPATDYSLRIISEDEDGNTSSSPFLFFTTSIWLDPPIISRLQTSSALITGRVEKVQTIFSWRTDKPATSRIFYTPGVITGTDFAFSTPLNEALTTDHIIITTALEPGRVYTFRAQSIDALGNISFSTNFTLLAPQPRQDVVQLIINQFREIFGFF